MTFEFNKIEHFFGLINKLVEFFSFIISIKTLKIQSFYQSVNLIIPSHENLFFPSEDKGRRKKRKDFILQKRRKKGKSTFERTSCKDLSPFSVLKPDIGRNADKRWDCRLSRHSFNQKNIKHVSGKATPFHPHGITLSGKRCSPTEKQMVYFT